MLHSCTHIATAGINGLRLTLQGAVQDQLLYALEEARRRAEREKHEKWLRKLEAGHHDTSKLRANFESMYAFSVISVQCRLWCGSGIHPLHIVQCVRLFLFPLFYIFAGYVCWIKISWWHSAFESTLNCSVVLYRIVCAIRYVAFLCLTYAKVVLYLWKK